jgi:hypothetical protein
MASRPGGKGLDLEEALKGYFWRAGYFVVRGVPYRLDGDDVTDVDLWLYERPAAFTRRRLIVDVKNRRSPKAAERIIWVRGLQSALAVDGVIVASTDKRPSTRRLAKALNVTLLDGDALVELAEREQLHKTAAQWRTEDLVAAVKQIDRGRRSSEWREAMDDARSSLISGIGVQSTNRSLAANAFFADQVLNAFPRSEQAQVGLRLVYFTCAFVALSLDYLLAEQAFRAPEERRQSIINSIRFGQSDALGSLPIVRAAIGLTRKYVENGAAAAKQIEHGFYGDANQIPAEIIADYVTRVASSDALFNVAREIDSAAWASELPSFDALSTEAKSLLGVVMDFNGISRQKIASAWPHIRSPRDHNAGTEYQPGPLFNQTTAASAAKGKEG